MNSINDMEILNGFSQISLKKDMSMKLGILHVSAQK